jgi:hypothetical protein
VESLLVGAPCGRAPWDLLGSLCVRSLREFFVWTFCDMTLDLQGHCEA